MLTAFSAGFDGFSRITTPPTEEELLTRREIRAYSHSRIKDETLPLKGSSLILLLKVAQDPTRKLMHLREPLLAHHRERFFASNPSGAIDEH
jgi:hypothetical protein